MHSPYRTNLEAEVLNRRLPLLGEVRIAAPCKVDWDSLQGTNTQRHCGQCDKQVYNLSAMTEAQAARIVANENKPCVRLYLRVDGTFLTQDCPVGLKLRKRRSRVAAALTLAGLGLVSALGFARTAMQLRAHRILVPDERESRVLEPMFGKTLEAVSSIGELEELPEEVAPSVRARRQNHGFSTLSAEQRAKGPARTAR
jgi:hypothetical protein